MITIKTARFSGRIHPALKAEWIMLANKYHLNLTEFIIHRPDLVDKFSCRFSSVTYPVHKTRKRQREVIIESAVFTKKGRQLPLIPGTPAWKAAKQRMLEIAMIDELKIKLEERRRYIDAE